MIIINSASLIVDMATNRWLVERLNNKRTALLGKIQCMRIYRCVLGEHNGEKDVKEGYCGRGTGM